MAGYLVEDQRKVTTHRLVQMKAEGKKIAMLTSYDYTTATITRTSIGGSKLIENGNTFIYEQFTAGKDGNTYLVTGNEVILKEVIAD